VDWGSLPPSECIRFLSVRGRNLGFAEHIADVLQLDKIAPDRFLRDYKAAFTAKAVRRIYEGVLEFWPPDTDIQSVLARLKTDVSGLYIGDYDPNYISRGLVRHSIYASKLLVVDPFIHPYITSEKYNPILHPEEYRAQTLKNVNFYFSLIPWIDEGIVEIIRVPTDFDRQLNWDLMKAQKKKFAENAKLKEAVDKSLNELGRRHMHRRAYEMLLLGAPDDALRRILKKIYPDGAPISEEEFIRSIQAQRDANPNFLEPLGKGPDSAQLHMESSGTHYSGAKLTAQLTGSYLFTDLDVRWNEIEFDRESTGAANAAWAPFAKSMQEAKLKYLDNLKLDHALMLRKEGRLEQLRSFLHKVWRSACSAEPFDERNSVALATELTDEVRKADVEWAKINRDLVKILGAGLAGFTMAGPMIAQGNAAFLAAAAGVSGAATLIHDAMRRRKFPDEYPAAFFMRVKSAE
jgi:hypothetical protein